MNKIKKITVDICEKCEGTRMFIDYCNGLHKKQINSPTCDHKWKELEIIDRRDSFCKNCDAQKIVLKIKGHARNLVIIEDDGKCDHEFGIPTTLIRKMEFIGGLGKDKCTNVFHFPERPDILIKVHENGQIDAEYKNEKEVSPGDMLWVVDKVKSVAEIKG
ncbi:MAG: hypothetical protein ACTSRU_20550 [Candidatus Hodarchaeales archaeon]